jgi:hypothetical protein
MTDEKSNNNEAAEQLQVLESMVAQINATMGAIKATREAQDFIARFCILSETGLKSLAGTKCHYKALITFLALELATVPLEVAMEAFTASLTLRNEEESNGQRN